EEEDLADECLSDGPLVELHPIFEWSIIFLFDSALTALLSIVTRLSLVSSLLSFVRLSRVLPHLLAVWRLVRH
ncbi:hypothetical protein PMAYCL1PPCAC_15347, partial [Pristionchus mayeri]